MATTEELQLRLGEAEKALHTVTVGKQAASVSYDGNSFSYNQANVADLRAYIARLRSSLGMSVVTRRALSVSL